MWLWKTKVVGQHSFFNFCSLYFGVKLLHNDGFVNGNYGFVIVSIFIKRNYRVFTIIYNFNYKKLLGTVHFFYTYLKYVVDTNQIVGGMIFN